MTTKNGNSLRFTLNNLTSSAMRVYALRRVQVARPERAKVLEANGLISALRHVATDPYRDTQATQLSEVRMWSWENIVCPGDALLTFVARNDKAGARYTVVAEFVILKGVAGVSI